MTPSSIVGRMDRRYYPAHGDLWDADLFRQLVLRHLPHATAVLDYGAGRGALPAMNFRGAGPRVSAVDVDEAVLGNPYVDDAKVLGTGGTIPYGDKAFDLVIAHNVLEHVPDPVAAFREIHRVLRPGGVFLGKTPNRNHYVPLIARLTPHAFHIWINRLRGRDDEDTFPTVYRCNTRSAVLDVARKTGFEVAQIETVEGRPEYLRMNALLYTVGLGYERIVNRLPWLNAFRGVLYVTLRRRTDG
jgi:SAM-dependent methyltransferase